MMSIILNSFAEGRAISLAQVNDPVFSKEILGKGIAIEPDIGEIYAPADGIITLIADAKHCIGMKTEGLELLIHVGMDTVSLRGKFFNPLVSTGQKVQKGETLLKFNIRKLKSQGFDTIIPLVITNHNQYADLTFSYGSVTKQDTIIVAAI